MQWWNFDLNGVILHCARHLPVCFHYDAHVWAKIKKMSCMKFRHIDATFKWSYLSMQKALIHEGLSLIWSNAGSKSTTSEGLFYSYLKLFVHLVLLWSTNSTPVLVMHTNGMHKIKREREQNPNGRALEVLVLQLNDDFKKSMFSMRWHKHEKYP